MSRTAFLAATLAAVSISVPHVSVQTDCRARADGLASADGAVAVAMRGPAPAAGADGAPHGARPSGARGVDGRGDAGR